MAESTKDFATEEQSWLSPLVHNLYEREDTKGVAHSLTLVRKGRGTLRTRGRRLASLAVGAALTSLLR